MKTIFSPTRARATISPRRRRASAPSSRSEAMAAAASSTPASPRLTGPRRSRRRTAARVLPGLAHLDLDRRADGVRRGTFEVEVALHLGDEVGRGGEAAGGRGLARPRSCACTGSTSSRLRRRPRASPLRPKRPISLPLGHEVDWLEDLLHVAGRQALVQAVDRGLEPALDGVGLDRRPAAGGQLEGRGAHARLEVGDEPLGDREDCRDAAVVEGRLGLLGVQLAHVDVVGEALDVVVDRQPAVADLHRAAGGVEDHQRDVGAASSDCSASATSSATSSG